MSAKEFPASGAKSFRPRAKARFGEFLFTERGRGGAGGRGVAEIDTDIPLVYAFVIAVYAASSAKSKIKTIIGAYAMVNRRAQHPTTRCILRLPQVKERVGLGRSKIYDMIKKGEFPAPIKIASHASGWNSDAVQSWVDARLDAPAA